VNPRRRIREGGAGGNFMWEKPSFADDSGGRGKGFFCFCG